MLSSIFCDEVGHLAHRPDANVLFHVVDERHRRRHSVVFTTNKPLELWGRVLHDPDLAEAILDRILERGRIVTPEGLSMRARHLDPVPGLRDQETASWNAFPALLRTVLWVCQNFRKRPARITGTHNDYDDYDYFYDDADFEDYRASRSGGCLGSVLFAMAIITAGIYAALVL